MAYSTNDPFGLRLMIERNRSDTLPPSWQSGAIPDVSRIQWPLKSSVYVFPGTPLEKQPKPAYESMLLNAGYDAEVRCEQK